MSIENYFEQQKGITVDNAFKFHAKYTAIDICSFAKKYNESEMEKISSIIKTHTEKLNTMKDNLSHWEEENWSDTEVQECENMIKILASILSDLNRSLKDK